MKNALSFIGIGLGAYAALSKNPKKKQNPKKRKKGEMKILSLDDLPELTPEQQKKVDKQVDEIMDLWNDPKTWEKIEKESKEILSQGMKIPLNTPIIYRVPPSQRDLDREQYWDKKYIRKSSLQQLIAKIKKMKLQEAEMTSGYTDLDDNESIGISFHTFHGDKSDLGTDTLMIVQDDNFFDEDFMHFLYSRLVYEIFGEVA